MTTTPEVHWHEGLFLQPQHLQAMQRHQQAGSVAMRRTLLSYPYGLVEAKLSSDALSNMLVRFDSLHVVMRSGVEVRFPGNAELPPLDIKERFETGSGTFNILLGVPVWYNTRGNAIEPGGQEDWRSKRMFRVSETERLDDNTGENAQPIALRYINARLMFPDEDQTDMETIPLLRVTRAAGEDVGLPRSDPNFIPACMLLNGNTMLRDLVRDLSNAVEASRRELVVQMTRAGFSVESMRGQQFQMMLRLKTLNRFSARLPHLAVAPAVTPFEMYLELRELLGELAALHPDRDPFEVAAYNHDEPAIAFLELAEKVRAMLKPLKGDVFRKIPFTLDDGVLVANLSDDDLTVPNEYFLGIRSSEDPRAMAALVEDEDKFKLMTRSMVQHRIRGVKLKEERHPPVQLPSETGLHYYRLLRSESKRMWDQISQEKVAAIWWPGLDTTDFRITLYMTVPDGKA